MGQQQWLTILQQQVEENLAMDAHGKMSVWRQALASLPDVKPSTIELKDKVAIGLPEDINDEQRALFLDHLSAFHPWRKGPYELFGIYLDTEWRSDWKWDRILPHIRPLKDKRVLDVGGGNGYHGWRMLGEEAKLVVGIDPTRVFAMQYQVMQRYMGETNHYVLPIGIEDLPENLMCFDTVFSMGVLYHRRSPIDHLYELKACLRPGGELVLETLVIEGDEGEFLMPGERYAKMRNVWFIPTVATMLAWLKRCGFRHVSCADTNTTTLEEQRRTDWMHFESLADFLDPKDRSKTIEGYPAPIRAVFIAHSPK
jgi:tRNA (mo5U34)-methyltransferase